MIVESLGYKMTSCRTMEDHIHLEKLKGPGQTVTPEELHCLQRRYHQQKRVVPARSRDEYVQEAATPRGGDDNYGGLKSNDMGTYGGLLSGVVLARSHPSSTLYCGIEILCTLINKAWFTYNSYRLLKTKQ